MSGDLKQVATEFLRLVAANEVSEAYRRHVAPGFRHHNPFFAGDAASLQQAMQTNAEMHPGKELEIKVVVAEGDRVVTLSHVRQNPQDRGAAVVHVFRIEGGRIVELWDIGQPIPEPMINQNGMF